MITVEEILGYEPCKCYSKERLCELWAGRESLSPQEVAELNIPDRERIWILCHCLAYRDLAVLLQFAQNWGAKVADPSGTLREVEFWAPYWAKAAYLASQNCWLTSEKGETKKEQNQIKELVTALLPAF